MLFRYNYLVYDDMVKTLDTGFNKGVIYFLFINKLRLSPMCYTYCLFRYRSEENKLCRPSYNVWFFCDFMLQNLVMLVFQKYHYTWCNANARHNENRNYVFLDPGKGPSEVGKIHGKLEHNQNNCNTRWLKVLFTSVL